MGGRKSTPSGYAEYAVLQDFGLTPFFTNQLTVEELDDNRIGRVTEVQRSLIRVFDGSNELALPLPANYLNTASVDRPTVGDWVVFDEKRSRIERILERKSAFRRVAAGEKARIQLIAANVDILLVVTSCNQDFNESRLERYLALAAEAGVFPVVVLTKIDLCDEPGSFEIKARRVKADVPVVSINALDSSTFGDLLAWIEPGCTVALVGSSGVGKSTILNTLMGRGVAATAGIREDDKKGRHTTSHRALHKLPGGGLLIDVPGMRELKVADIDEALKSVFGEIESLAMNCRFSDCHHQAEPGCAVRRAIEKGELDERRLNSYLKLLRENQHHNASLSEARKADRDLAKKIKQAVAWKKGIAGED